MVTGLGQMISGAIKKKQAEKMKPGMEDPDQRAALEATQQRMKSSYAGTDATTAANMRAIDQGTRQTQQAISKNTGGNVGGTMSALLQSQRTGAGQANQAFAGAAQRGSHFQGLGDMMQSRISQRKLELGMLDYQQKMGEAMENKKAGFGNLMQGVQSSMGQTGKGPDLSAMSYKPTTVSNTATPYQPVMGGMSTQIQGRPSVTGMQPSQQQGQVNTGAIPNYNSAANSMSFGQPQQAPNSSGAGIQQSPPIQAPNYGKPNPIKVGGNPSNNGAMNYQADDDEKKEEQAYRVGMNDVKQ
jgi:hypothetical protein